MKLTGAQLFAIMHCLKKGQPMFFGEVAKKFFEAQCTPEVREFWINAAEVINEFTRD
nr:hypothetical protein 4 [Dehalococcoidia bacterium]